MKIGTRNFGAFEHSGLTCRPQEFSPAWNLGKTNRSISQFDSYGAVSGSYQARTTGSWLDARTGHVSLEHADDASVVDFGAGIARGVDGDRHGDALQQREVVVQVQRLRQEAVLPLASPQGWSTL
jgi:hypothetical protein